MKTARQWVNENSQSGPFDTVGCCADAEALVREIQADAIRSEAAADAVLFLANGATVTLKPSKGGPFESSLDLPLNRN
jgi:hypothetical protein